MQRSSDFITTKDQKITKNKGTYSAHFTGLSRLRALLLFVVKLRLGFRIGIASGRSGNLRHVRLGSLRYGATGMTGHVLALVSPRPPVQADSGNSAPGDGRTPGEVGNGLGLGAPTNADHGS